MALFSKISGNEIQAVVDLGTDSIKGVVFRVEDGGKKVQVIKKIRSPLSELQKEKSGHKLHEFLFNMVRELEKIPGKITIAIGPHIGKYSIAHWSFPTKGGAKINNTEDAKKYFQNLFEQHREPGKALVAYPLNLVANGYVMPHDFEYSELKKTETLAFRTLMVYLPDSIGADLLDTKESLGGMPIEFVPRVVAYKEALAGGLGKKDLFLVEVENQYCTIALIKEGELAEARTFAFKDLAEWEKIFLSELAWFYTAGPISPEVLFFGSREDLANFADRLRTNKWLGEYSFVDSPQLIQFEAQNIFKGDTLKGEIRGASEVGLGSLVYYSLNHKSLL